MVISEIIGLGHVYNWVRKLLDVRYRHVKNYYPVSVTKSSFWDRFHCTVFSSFVLTQESPDWTETCRIIKVPEKVVKACEFDVRVRLQDAFVTSHLFLPSVLSLRLLAKPTKN
jgi:hypothetical protein